ncbi:MAG: DUF362 domain-containing protein [Planctomycetaceae bacterium]|jgi:uncharacterized protein (DUF362 family)|nr:DUF362 domain-containing protein [Planctomycetaceae bacterium]
MTTINIIYGTAILEMTYKLLRETAAGNITETVKRLRSDMKVVIKPNLVVAKPANEGATTHPEIVEGIVRFLKDFGVTKPVIAEGSWLGEQTGKAFSCCGYDVLAKRYGLQLVDTKKENTVKKNACGLTLGICNIFLEADFLINVPVLKGHCQTVMTCCLKNLKGCIPDSEKRRYHNIGLHKPVAALNTILKPDLHVIDGICGDPVFEEGGNPVTANRILLGTDPVLLDSYGAALLGYTADEIEYIHYAKEYGAGNLFNTDTKINEFQTENRPKNTVQNQSRLVRELAPLIEDRNACSACYAALIFALHKLGVNNSGRKITETFKIGQGFRGKQSTGIGIGDCAKGCEQHISGCPPSAAAIVRALKNVTAGFLNS